MAEYSFDVVAKVDRQELSNALDMTKKEVDNRFDFKGATVDIKLEKEHFNLAAPDQMKLNQLIDIIQTKLIKRGLNLKAFKFGEFESNVTGVTKSKVDIQNGLTSDQAKKITRLIKDSKLKVQAKLQSNQVRVTGKTKDDLQSVQELVRGADFEFHADFENYR